MFLISLISPPAGLDCVEVEADLTLTTEDDPTSTHLVSVKTFRMLNDRVTLAVLRAITDRVKINTLSLLVSVNHIYIPYPRILTCMHLHLKMNLACTYIRT